MRTVVNTLAVTLALLAVSLQQDADAAIDARQPEVAVATNPLDPAVFDPAPKGFPSFSRFKPYENELASIAPLPDIARPLSPLVNLPALKLLDLRPVERSPGPSDRADIRPEAAQPAGQQQVALSPQDLSPALMTPGVEVGESNILSEEAAPVAPKPAPSEANVGPDKRMSNVELPALPRPRPHVADRKPASSGLGRITFARFTLAPMGHTLFCLKYPDDCQAQKDVLHTGPITLTDDRRAELVRVNAEVNSAIHPTNVSGVISDKWLISPTSGNCNDYAVTKRHKLLALGWPSRDLLLAEVVTTWGEHHLVLVVRTDKGDLVADSLDKRVRNWAEAPYRWVRVETPNNPKLWATIETPQPDLVAMAGHDHQL